MIDFPYFNTHPQQQSYPNPRWFPLPNYTGTGKLQRRSGVGLGYTFGNTQGIYAVINPSENGLSAGRFTRWNPVQHPNTVDLSVQDLIVAFEWIANQTNGEWFCEPGCYTSTFGAGLCPEEFRFYFQSDRDSSLFKLFFR